jgi:hypothetical protein
MRCCPFCGSTKLQRSTNVDTPILCRTCGAAGPTPNFPHDRAEEVWDGRAKDLPWSWIAYILVLLCLLSVSLL